MVWYGMVWYGMVWYGMVCMYVFIFIYLSCGTHQVHVVFTQKPPPILICTIFLFSPRVVQSILCEIFLLSILSKYFFEIKESFKHSLVLQSLLQVVLELVIGYLN